MKITIGATLIFLIWTTCSGDAQHIEPLELAKKIFSKEGLSNLEKYVTDEYQGKPNGQDLNDSSTTKFLLLGQKENSAIVVMTILDKSNKGVDTYLHFKKDSIWKMSAFRGLAMTGMIEQIKIGLEKMTPQQVDDIIEKSKKNKPYAIFTSWEEYHFKLGNARLILDLDDNIIQHFLTNQPEFERIKELAIKQLDTQKTDNERSVTLVENLKTDYQKIFISSVSSGGFKFGSCLDFLIGGMVDNTVGYLFVRDKKDLPQMSSESIIMLREIGNGWYLYKTT